MDRELQNCDVREELERLIRLKQEEFVLHLPKGITLVTFFPDSDISCEKYSIGTSGYRHSIPAIYPKLDSLKVDDLALYYCCEEAGIVHVGRIQEDGFVISKWGNHGPILRHPVNMVPTSYGNYIFFRRVPQENIDKLKKNHGALFG